MKTNNLSNSYHFHLASVMKLIHSNWDRTKKLNFIWYLFILGVKRECCFPWFIWLKNEGQFWKGVSETSVFLSFFFFLFYWGKKTWPWIVQSLWHIYRKWTVLKMNRLWWLVSKKTIFDSDTSCVTEANKTMVLQVLYQQDAVMFSKSLDM